jgi:hypothetical protein
MAVNHRFARRDLKHKEVANKFKELGYSVLDLSYLENCCDFVATNGSVVYFVEVKNGYNLLTEGEIKFIRNFKSQVYVLENAKQVEKLVVKGEYELSKRIERQLIKDKINS